MFMLTEILNYQAVEAKINKLEKELNANGTKTALANMVTAIKQEQNTLLELEDKAKEIFDGFEKCKAEYAKAEEILEKLIATSVDDKNEKEIAELNKKITDMTNKITTLGRNISQLSMQANQILKDFDKAKNNIITSKGKHKQAKEEYDKQVASIEPQIAELKKELASLEKKVDSKVMERYKKARQDGIFPVFVPLKDGVCGGCRMSLSAAYNSKLKEQGYVECEQCRRLIYLK